MGLDGSERRSSSLSKSISPESVVAEKVLVFAGVYQCIPRFNQTRMSTAARVQ